MSAIDCPALRARHIEEGYPFGNRVPLTIRITKTVVPDFAFLGNVPPPCIISETYPAWTNSYGAVSAVHPDGRRLGVKPDEFEVIEWTAFPS